MTIDDRLRESGTELRAIAQTIERQPIGPVRRRRPGWAYAMATAVIALLLIGGVWLSSFLGEETQPVITQPTTPATTTITAPPTSIPPTPAPVTLSSARITGPPTAGLPLSFSDVTVPAFEATIHQIAFYSKGGVDQTVDSEVGIVIQVAYGGSDSNFLAEIIEAPQDPAGRPIRGTLFGLYGPASFRSYDSDLGIHSSYNHDTLLVRRPEPYDPLKMLGWHHPTPTSWEQICQRTNQEVIAQGEVADRLAHVVLCEGLNDTWTVWVDKETGLVLKLDHETSALRVPAVGRFEVQTISYAPTFSADAFDITVPSGVEIRDEEPSPIPPAPSGTTTTIVAPSVPAYSEDLDLSKVERDTALIGEPFPGFTATLLTGETYELPESPDKPLIMLAWWAANSYITGNGFAEIIALDLFEAYYKQYGDTIDFIAVVMSGSSTPPEVVEMIRDAHGYTFPIAVDPRPFRRLIGAASWVLIETDGNVTATFCACTADPAQAAPLLISKAIAAAG